jgi:preprotein translocase subunit SecF
MGATLRKAGESNYIIRLPEVKSEDRTKVQEALVLGEAGGVEKRFSTVGPVLGREAIANSAFALILVIVGIILFIWRAFRNITAPIPSWKYGIVAIVALIHDVVIPMGVFAVLGAFAGVEVDSLFVTALLVILGFSIHDTIVVFDRVRENLHTATALEKKDFAQIVGKSISETFVRSINTSLTTVFSIVALMVFGPESVRLFAIALLIGISFGTYSSIFIASPLLVTIDAFQNRARK